MKRYAVFYPTTLAPYDVYIRTSEPLPFDVWRDLVRLRIQEDEEVLRCVYALKSQEILQFWYPSTTDLIPTENILREAGFVKTQAGRLDGLAR